MWPCGTYDLKIKNKYNLTLAQGVTKCACQPTSRVCLFDVAAWYFEEPFQDLKETKKTDLIKLIQCSDVLVQCQQLAAVSVNVCGAAEAPEEQAGK